MPNRIRVLCVDDHQIVREGICLLISQQPDMEVVGLASTAEQSVELFRRERPDVTLMDLRLGSGSGAEATRAILREHPDARVIALTMYQSVEAVSEALQAGAVTYLSKNSPSADLIRVIREVHAGLRPMDPAVKARIDERPVQPPLTHREVEVMELVSQGMRNKEIAAHLGIREETVEVHLKHIFLKMHVNDRTGAVRVAMYRGIIQMG